MAQETGSLELASSGVDQILEGVRGPDGVTLTRLVLSVILIGLGAVIFACLAASATVLALYLRHGSEWLSEFYQELRFDFRLKTLMGTIVVGTLYVGLAAATILAAAAHARRRWPSFVAWTRVQGDRRAILAIVTTTLLYAIVATLAMALMRDRRIVVSGSTDLALIGTITANLVILAPLAEELFFRGWLYTSLRARFSFWTSFLATLLIFVAIHWDATHRRSLLVLPLAVALGVLREVTGSIKPTIALHAFYNLVIILVTLLELEA